MWWTRWGTGWIVFDLSGRKLFSFGKQGSENGEFNYPTHIAIDSADNLYIMDTLNFRVADIRQSPEGS